MFAILGALAGAIIDIIVIVCLAVGLISLPFILIGWIVGKIKA